MAEKREQTPMKVVFPNPEKIQCRTCANRDRTEITIGKKAIPVGITKDFCDEYTIEQNGKPYEVLFLNAECPRYIEDKFRGD